MSQQNIDDAVSRSSQSGDPSPLGSSNSPLVKGGAFGVLPSAMYHPEGESSKPKVQGGGKKPISLTQSCPGMAPQDHPSPGAAKSTPRTFLFQISS